MLQVLFTLDYEIHGNGDGSPYELMVEPTARLLDLFDEYGAKLTVMADVAEIIRFRDHLVKCGRDDFHFEAIVSQLRDAVRRGHDVQLHLHCSYLNARLEGGRWIQDWNEYNFAGLPYARMVEVIRIGKEFLEQTLRPHFPQYRCHTFRAANWAVQPSAHVTRALLQNGIEIDSSVFKFGQRRGLVSFDYTHAPSNLLPWLASAGDLCTRDDGGRLIEVPIYAENRRAWAFVTQQRLYRAWLSRKHKVNQSPAPDNRTSVAEGHSGIIAKVWRLATQRHAWKADFNQCSGPQLVSALRRAQAAHGGGAAALPFVSIGHSKLFTRRNGRSLAPFLKFVATNPKYFAFGTFGLLGLDADRVRIMWQKIAPPMIEVN